MGILAWIVLGAIAGIIAEKVMKTRTGIIGATIIGIVGALLGGFLAKVVFHVHSLNGFFNLSTWITAIVGAIVLLAVVHLLEGSRRTGRI